MRDFKFFNNNEDEEIENHLFEGASWIYGRVNNLIQYQYDIIIDNHFGIHSFLNHFPPGYVVCVLSITGPNGRIHTADTQYENGWGFDILNDLIIIEWVKFRNETI